MSRHALTQFSRSMASFNLFIAAMIFSTFISISNGGFSEELTDATIFKRMEKTSHLRFYFHDILGGKAPSACKIAGMNRTDAFGNTYIIDDALTEGKDPSSKLVGRAQGMYVVTSQQQQELALLMVVNYEFIEGKYNGSSISVLGRNPVMHDVREMPIVGGSGLFRFARGYALAHTVSFDPKTLDAIVEYNVYVMHY